IQINSSRAESLTARKYQELCFKKFCTFALNPIKMKNLLLLTLSACLLISCGSTRKTKNGQPQWIQLFNGKDLNDWTIKIAKHDLNENYKNTFRVENGVLKASAEGYDDFNQQYGHIYYKKPFSAYLIAVEYRFTGEQAKGGEGWAWRNSGVMLHCQAP